MGCRDTPLPFFALTVDAGQCSALRSGHFTSGIHYIGGWVAPDAVEKRKLSCPCRKSNFGNPSRSSSLFRPVCPSFIYSRSRSRSHVTTDGRSVSISKRRTHSGTCDQILLSVRRMLSERCCHISVGHPL
jgi:hypothetical protein